MFSLFKIQKARISQGSLWRPKPSKLKYQSVNSFFYVLKVPLRHRSRSTFSWFVSNMYLFLNYVATVVFSMFPTCTGLECIQEEPSKTARGRPRTRFTRHDSLFLRLDVVLGFWFLVSGFWLLASGFWGTDEGTRARFS